MAEGVTGEGVMGEGVMGGVRNERERYGNTRIVNHESRFALHALCIKNVS